MTDPRIKPLEPIRWVDPMITLSSDDLDWMQCVGGGFMRQRTMTADEI